MPGTRGPGNGGEADFGGPAELIGHPARAAILLALLDGRALPMSMLAGEAGVAASTASSHLARLVDGKLLRVRQQGRHRYYELASAEVAQALEALARLVPPKPVRSLRAGTRARALRVARTCYDHLGGYLGVAIMQSLIDRDLLVGGTGAHDPDLAEKDRLSSTGKDLSYELSSEGWTLLDALDVEVEPGRRQLVGYCVDWTEQRHHLGGTVGAALLDRFEALDWVRPGAHNVERAVEITAAGRDGFAERFGIDTDHLVAAA